MFNQSKLEFALSEYKNGFLEHWQNEKYKWVAIEHFQKHWDINAPDFRLMLEKATEKTYNLLVASNFFPRKMILDAASVEPETVRQNFIRLFDERIDLENRISDFIENFKEIKNRVYGPIGNHYQTVNSISTYLWLKYPDKYYIYKYSEYRDVSKYLEHSFVPTKKSPFERMKNGFVMFDELCEFLKSDNELVSMFNELDKTDCYRDPESKTLTVDFGFYIYNYLNKGETYTITEADWNDLLVDEEVFTSENKKLLDDINHDFKKLSMDDLSQKYGDSSQNYQLEFFNLSNRIVERLKIKKSNDVNFEAHKELIFSNIKNDVDITTSTQFELDENFKNSLKKQLIIKTTQLSTMDEVSYWWLNANPNMWSFSMFQVGGVHSYTLFNENGNKRKIIKNFEDVKVGDLIICYESYPVKQVVALAKVVNKDLERLYFEKTENLLTPIDYLFLKESEELKDMEYFHNQMGSLFNLRKSEYDFINELIREMNPISKINATTQVYDKNSFLSEVFIDESSLNTLINLLKNKKNIILQGAPGVGKTFAAKRLAYVMMGMQDDSRIESIQFHQNYSYEDFVMGYRPSDDGFKLVHGVFYRFCQQASNHPDKDYFFIIDEINRGNLSKIFGELLYLIEKDYRGSKITLAYNGTLFSVPSNIFIIGMMNTADRSLAMIDYALRRRFSFYEMEPGFYSSGFKSLLNDLDSESLNEIIEIIKQLNIEISKDNALGKGFRIGHSYFCAKKMDDNLLRSIVDYEIIPMLQEYWFDDEKKVIEWTNKLKGVFDDE